MVRGRLSDIEYLAIKEFDGKLVSNETQTNSFAGPTDAASLTASTGKDLYLAKAALTAVNTTGATSIRDLVAELQVNGVVVETCRLVVGDIGAGPEASGQYEFKNIGHSVPATQIIKIRIVQNPDILVESVIEGFEEDTGQSPAI